MRYYFKKMAEAGPSSTSTKPTEEETRADTDVIASEVQRVNRILEIENLDWERQLKQAVSVSLFILWFSAMCSPPLPLLLPY